MKIADINPWWKTPRIEEDLEALPRRDLFEEIVPFINERQVVAINGLRRTGKTVLMHHLISFLLKEHPAKNILYFNFDLFDDKIENILASYKELLAVNTKKEKIFVFLDEIQKHENWENEVKVLYDNCQSIKFFISGSSSLFIEKKTRESLAGRVFSFTLKPLTFKEYIKLKKLKIGKKIFLFEEELKGALQHYLRTGGFPELLSFKEEAKIDRYIKELVIDRVVYIDTPQVFEIEEPELLTRILSIVSASPGLIVDYENLADDLGRNRKTISSYLFYLEKAFLVKKLYNYSKNLLTSEKKMKKVYPASTAFASLFNAPKGKIVETAVSMNHAFKFFSRSGEKEVDFIGVNNEIQPVEVKYAGKVREREIRGLIKFMEKQNLKKGTVITKNFEAKKEIKKKNVLFIPLWKWLLEENSKKSSPKPVA